MENNTHNIIVKSRQTKNTLIAKLFLLSKIYKADKPSKTLILSINYENAVIHNDIIEHISKLLSADDKGMVIIKKNSKMLKFENGCEIYYKAYSKNSMERGITWDNLLIDSMAYIGNDIELLNMTNYFKNVTLISSPSITEHNEIFRILVIDSILKRNKFNIFHNKWWQHDEYRTDLCLKLYDSNDNCVESIQVSKLDENQIQLFLDMGFKYSNEFYDKMKRYMTDRQLRHEIDAKL